MVTAQLEMKETKMGEVLHVRLETICFLISRIVFQILLNMLVLKILIPKVKPIAIASFDRPPNGNDFLNIFSNYF